MLEYGIYISKDIEIVITEKYILAFRRVNTQNALESCLLEKEDDGSCYSYVGICRSLPATTIAYPIPRKWEYAFKGARKKYSNATSLAEWIVRTHLTLQQHEDGITLIFPDGDSYSACKTEIFSMGDLNLPPPYVSDTTLGECLKCWHMGCHEEVVETSDNDCCTSVSINTARHMYIFHMLPNDFYCRAARYSTNNSGVVFNQNFRQRNSDMSETYMVDDNTISGDPLPIDSNNFGACQIINYDDLMKKHLTDRERSALCYRYGLNGFERKTQAEIAGLFGISRSAVSKIQRKALKTIVSVIPKPADNTIYWTVSSYTDNQIILNGCQGDVYEWNKPAR